MDLFERIIFFVMGGSVGFILGFVAARLRSIETKVDEVQQEVHEIDVALEREHDERGSFRWPSVMAIGMVLVVALTAYAAFSASRTNALLKDTVACLTEYNTNQGVALDIRDRAIKTAADSEIELWGFYNKLYKQAQSDPSKIPVLQEQLNKSIMHYRDKLIETQRIRETYEYDDPDVLKDCKTQKENEDE